MAFALLFIIAFLIGFLIYRFNGDWKISVLIPMGLFLLTTLADSSAKDAWAFSLIFGLPLVFFASLLGAYVVQIRNPDQEELGEPANDASQSHLSQSNAETSETEKH